MIKGRCTGEYPPPDLLKINPKAYRFVGSYEVGDEPARDVYVSIFSKNKQSHDVMMYDGD